MRIPVERADTPWLNAVTSAVVHPLHAPNRDALVAAVVRLSTRAPQSRLGWGIDAHARHWDWDAGSIGSRAEQMVTACEDDPAQDFGAFSSAQARRQDTAWPTSVFAGADFVGVRMSHAVGDGRLVIATLAGIIREASHGDVDWSHFGAPTSSPYQQALRQFYGRSPRRLARSVMASRPQVPRRAQAADELAWEPSRCAVYRQIRPEQVREMAAWRKADASGATNASMHLLLLMRAFRAVGLGVRANVRVLFDLRRYLPDGQVNGNFVVGLTLPIHAGMRPTEVSSMLSDVAGSGRPLTAFGAGLLMRRTPDVVPHQVSRRPIPEIAFTHLSRPQEIERLPWMAGRRRVFTGSVEPAGPEGLTLALTETGGCVHLSATFHTNVIDETLVEAALTLAADDPLALLREPAQGRRAWSQHAEHAGGFL